MQPTHVVVDIRDGHTWSVGEDGKPMVEATAGRFAVIGALLTNVSRTLRSIDHFNRIK